eukprot:scaffold9130_cov14-Tisochrysis_lutea.AAC.1
MDAALTFRLALDISSHHVPCLQHNTEQLISPCSIIVLPTSILLLDISSHQFHKCSTDLARAGGQDVTAGNRSHG